jgi:hypothetical protein
MIIYQTTRVTKTGVMTTGVMTTGVMTISVKLAQVTWEMDQMAIMTRLFLQKHIPSIIYEYLVVVQLHCVIPLITKLSLVGM